MSEPKFSPGPWKLITHHNDVYPYPLSIINEDETMWVTRDGTTSSIANAQLIAAAPDMYKALQAMVLMTNPPPAIEKMAVTALAKARGEA